MIDLERQLRYALTPPLPGLDAQLRMAPRPRVGWDPYHPPARLREASEEVGVPPASVHLLGRLTPLQIPISGYMLHPVVGVLERRPVFRREEWEVARILEVPVTRLRDPAIVKERAQIREFGGKAVDIAVPYFEIEGEQVWGATAMVLAEFLAVIERH